MARPSVSSVCSTCPLLDAGFPPDAPSSAGAAIGVVHLAKGQFQTCEDMSRHFVLVQKGALKVEFLNLEGKPETAGFLFPGEPLVCSISNEDVAITALEETVICDVRLNRIVRDTPGASAILNRFTQALADQAGIDQRRLIHARSGSVEERLSWFIRDLADRQRSSSVHLAMPRRDIAHYLDASAESVSRAFSSLRRRGEIESSSPRKIALRA